MQSDVNIPPGLVVAISLKVTLTTELADTMALAWMATASRGGTVKLALPEEST